MKEIVKDYVYEKGMGIKMNYNSFHLTEIGASHIKVEKECQDFSISFQDEKMAVIVVGDGHGGDDYVRSAIGAKLVCGTAKKNIVNFLKNITIEAIKDNEQKIFEQLCSSIINGWNEAIYMHFSENPFTEEELCFVSQRAKKRYLEDKIIESAYGTTLIAAGITNDFWFGIQIGDGKCVTISKENICTQPIPWDDKCFLNATTSMCDTDALGSFRYYFSCEKPVAIFLGTDGIDDSFKNEKQLYSLYETIYGSFCHTEYHAAVKELADYLPRLTKKGSGDDVSIAAIIVKDETFQGTVISQEETPKDDVLQKEIPKEEIF